MADPQALRTACAEHAAMVEAVRRADREALDGLAVRHVENARRIYETKFFPISNAASAAGGP